MADRIIGVSHNDKFRLYWRFPDLPSPTLSGAPGQNSTGWLLIEHEANEEESR